MITKQMKYMITSVKEKFASMKKDGPSPQHEFMATIVIWIVNVHESILLWIHHQSFVGLLAEFLIKHDYGYFVHEDI